ncbi:hypothetical protein THAOC_25366, partial [Thalassiosira oceanica]
LNRPTRGKKAKTSKKSKKKQQNLFTQAKVDDEENKGPDQDRLLQQVSLSEKIEAKIDSKIGHLENNMSKKIGHLEDKIDKIENKMDKLEDLILSLLDATQQKLE